MDSSNLEKVGTPYEQLLAKLRALKTEYGASLFNIAYKRMRRERLENYTREKRIKYSHGMKQKLYDKQKGWCPWCRKQLDIPAGHNEVDHIDPNREDFNHKSNFQLLHIKCNREKNAKNVLTQAKITGNTITEILEHGHENH